MPALRVIPFQFSLGPMFVNVVTRSLPSLLIRSFLMLLFAAELTFFLSPNANATSPTYGRVVFPKDTSVVNAQQDLGAAGDGIKDDTAALQAGFDASSSRGSSTSTKILYIPNGTYRVTSALIAKGGIGPWVYGESRDGVVIRMDDGNTNSSSVIRTHPNESGNTSADWFMRTLRNFTVDVGNNPGVDGIRYYGNNSSILQNLRVIGNGKVGINAGFFSQSGPNLVQDCVIEGFETGISSIWIWGETLSRCTIRNCRSNGVVVIANSVAIEDLVVENTPVAVVCDYPNDWTWWGGVVALVGGRFSGTDPTRPAIFNRSVLYARDVTTTGFSRAITSSTTAGNVAGPNVTEYVSHGVRQAFPSPSTSLRLPIKTEPSFPWETNTSNWVCANDHGAVKGDNKDDTAAIQSSIDAAAAAGKTVVYFRGIGGGDPNWYTMNGDVHVHGSVRHIIALGFGRILGSGTGKFIVDDRSASLVKFQHIQGFGSPAPTIENRSSNATVVVESCDSKILGTGSGDIFVTDCPSAVELLSHTQSIWTRQLNPEGTSDVGLVRNHGGKLWCLGVKHEGAGVRFRNDNGGQTEIFGVFNYGPGNIAADDPRPMFEVDNSPLAVMGLREISFGSFYPVKLREVRHGEIRSLKIDTEGNWTGWSLANAWSPEETNGPIAVAWPRLLPATGTFSDSLTIQALTTTPGAVLRYTLDGSEPTPASPEFVNPFTVTHSGALKVKGFLPGREPSATAVGTYLQAEANTLVSITNIWRYNQTEDLTHTNWMATNYNDSAWPAGRGLLYVETAALPAPKNTPLVLGRTTYYFRTSFLAPTNLFPLTVTLSNLIDDGAIFYVNGAEVKRVRMDAGAVAYTNFANASPANGDATVWDVFTIPSSGIRPGTNWLAVEVHQVSATSGDIVFGCSLSLGAQRRASINTPPHSQTLQAGAPALMEVIAEGSPPLFYHWFHNGQQIAGATHSILEWSAVTANEVGIYSVVVSNWVSSVTSSNATLTLDPNGPPALLAARFNTSLTALTLSFHKPVTLATATLLSNYLLTDSNGQPIPILAAKLSNGTNIVLSTAALPLDGYTIAVTGLRDNGGQVVSAGTRASVGLRYPLIPISATWKYDQSGTDLGTAWRDPSFNDSGWSSGAALLAQEGPGLPEPIRTTLTVGPTKPTFYFRRTMQLPALPADATLSLRQVIDDGVIVWLNGEEFSRSRLTDPVTFNTFADIQPIDPAPYEGPVIRPANLLNAGTNVITAEVHQSAANSSDVVFGLELSLLLNSMILPFRSPRLHVEPVAKEWIRLWWDADLGYVLDTAQEITGPWTPAPQQTNPQTNPPSATTFFRLRQ